MENILERLAICVESGKINKTSPYPPNMKDQDGADELAKRALEEGVKPDEILENALIPAMANVGNKFSRKEIYVPPDVDGSKSNEQCHGSILNHFFSRAKQKEKEIYYRNCFRRPA